MEKEVQKIVNSIERVIKQRKRVDCVSLEEREERKRESQRAYSP